MGWVVGIDEAGRGSLVGELIVAAFGVREELVKELARLGVRDSKQLSREAREKLYPVLVRLGAFTVWPIPPALIDRENINRLEEEASSRALSILFSRIGGAEHVEELEIDKFGELRFLPRWLRAQGFSGRLVVEPYADSKYPVVSAASIIAKVVRDRRIDVLRSLYGVEGSGYPADESTVRWVMDVIRRGERPPIIRYSWGTLKGTGAYVEKAKRARRTLKDFMV